MGAQRRPLSGVGPFIGDMLEAAGLFGKFVPEFEDRPRRLGLNSIVNCLVLVGFPTRVAGLLHQLGYIPVGALCARLLGWGRPVRWCVPSGNYKS